jgi:serine/threonine protein kinase
MSESSSSSSSLRRSIQSIKDPYIGRIFMERYEIVRKLGNGQNGCVYLVDDINIQNRRIKQKAIKIIGQLNSESENELEMLFKINHENIVRYFDHFYLKIGNDNQTCLITEFCEVNNNNMSISIKNYSNLNIDSIDLERRFEEPNRRSQVL